MMLGAHIVSISWAHIVSTFVRHSTYAYYFDSFISFFLFQRKKLITKRNIQPTLSFFERTFCMYEVHFLVLFS
jgi:hypothetical protein